MQQRLPHASHNTSKCNSATAIYFAYCKDNIAQRYAAPEWRIGCNAECRTSVTLLAPCQVVLVSLLMNTNEHDAAVLEVELQTNSREGYAKFYNDGEGPY